MVNPAQFTRTAAQLVAANDRAARRAERRRRLRAFLVRRLSAAFMAWSAFVLAAIVLAAFPPSTRVL